MTAAARIPISRSIAHCALALAILIIFFPATVVYGAKPLVLTDDQSQYPMGLFLDILEDPLGQWKIQDIISPPISEHFTPSHQKTHNFGFTNVTYWVKFRIQNKSRKSTQWFLELEYPHLDNIQLYTPSTEDGGQYHIREAGDRLPFDKRPIRHRNFIFPIFPDKSKVKTYYMRFRSSGPMQFPLTFWTTTAFSHKDHRQQFAFGIYYGIMMVMALYNFFIFFSVKDRSYLFYVLYISSYALVQMTYNGLAFEWLWPGSPAWANIAMPFLMNLTLFWILVFTQSFLKTKTNTPVFHNVIRFLLAFLLIPMLMAFFHYSLSLELGLLLMICVAFTILSTGVLSFRKGYRPARYFLIAWIVFIGGLIMIVFRTVGIFPSNFFTEYGIQIGSAMEVTLLSLGLADRINQERKEKFIAQQNAMEAQNEAMANLKEADKLKSQMLAITEKKVEERTRELNKTLEKVEEANRNILESIRYARVIQRSLLPAHEEMTRNLDDCFVIWVPRDIVGGDIIFSDFFDDGFIIAVVDCTGHGVPGAFMTMIAISGLRKIIRDEGTRRPAEILKKLNIIVKTTLHQDSEQAISDDGLDAGVCHYQYGRPTLEFAGARMPLIYIRNENARILKGDKQSLGYKDSKLDFTYANHTIKLRDGMAFYLATDGFSDQLGGPKGISFGNGRFKDLLEKHSHKPFDEQKKALQNAFEKYRAGYDRQDDVTVVGFAIPKQRV